ncbi:hypothetical protein BGZ68_000960 [Mortierella alpina]|nr:hypothetical protein BGZ68_000960 [Mortierella alpina]
MAVPTGNHTVSDDVAEIRFVSMMPGPMLCIEVSDEHRTTGNPVQLAACNWDRVPEQQWQFFHGTILLSPSRREAPYCLDLPTDSNARDPDVTQEPDVVVNPCSGTFSQGWRRDFLRGNIFSIRNDATDTCLEAIPGDGPEGYQLTHNPCNEQHIGQQWTELE